MKSRFVIRVRIVSVLLILFALVLVGKLYLVQIVQGKDFSDKADRQYSKPQSNIFSRGSIFFQTKDGGLVSAATLKTGFTLAVNPQILKDPEDVWSKLNTIIPLDREVFLSHAQKSGDPYEEVAKKIGLEEAGAISILEIPGVEVYKERWRFYPGDSLASQTLGLLGYKGDEYAGRYGIERYYEDVLARDNSEDYTNFFAEIFTNIKKTIFEDRQLRGDVVTSIEPSVEIFLENKLKDINKAWSSDLSGGIIMDPKTGQIIAMAADPSFNPNSFQSESVALLSNPLVENVYEMGSIVKPLTMASGIDAGVVTPKTTYDDQGFLVLNTARIANYDGKGRGVVSMQQVLNQSLNTGVAFVVSKLGNKRFADYFKKLEMGEETGIDLPNEAHGLIENLDSTRDIEYATASYGQGIALTPIQMIRSLAVLANGGVIPHPHVATEIKYDIGGSKEVSFPPGNQIFKKETTDQVTQMLVEVVDTALLHGDIKNPRYSVAAKTGTAQIAKKEGGGYYTDRFLHSFFGYFPAYNPKFIVFLFTVYPKNVDYASETLTTSFADITQFLINYYEIPPDR